jgi:hypothetical protein
MPAFESKRKFRLKVVKFEQTAQTRPCQTYWRPGVTQVRCHAKKWRTFAAACEPFRLGSRQPFSQSLEDLKMSLETILIIVLVVFLLGGGGWYWGRGRG